MKITNIALSLALLGTLSLGMAEDTATVETSTTVSVDAQIEAIQEAPAQERVRLMNQFKQRLMNMNEADRAAAIEKLQARVQTQTQTRSGDATAQAEDAAKTMTQTRTRAQDRVQDMQTENLQEMNRMQNMNQHQMMNQAKDMGTVVPTSVPTTPVSR